jgi:hypothetical protein
MKLLNFIYDILVYISNLLGFDYKHEDWCLLKLHHPIHTYEFYALAGFFFYSLSKFRLSLLKG